LEIGQQFHVVLANFLLRMRRSGQISTSGQIFNPKFEIPMCYFLFKYEFWWHILGRFHAFWEIMRAHPFTLQKVT